MKMVVKKMMNMKVVLTWMILSGQIRLVMMMTYLMLMLMWVLVMVMVGLDPPM
jgi:hypothetical protein